MGRCAAPPPSGALTCAPSLQRAPVVAQRLDFIEPPQPAADVPVPAPRTALWVPSSAHPHRSGSFSVLGPHAPATCLRFDAGRQVLVSGHADNTVRVWAVRSGQFEPVFTLYGHTGAVTCLEFDGFKIVSGSRDRTIKVRPSGCAHRGDIARPRLIRALRLGVRARQIWSMDTGACETTLQGHTAAVVSLVFDEHRICSADEDGAVKLWSFRRAVFSAADADADADDGAATLDLGGAAAPPAKRLCEAVA